MQMEMAGNARARRLPEVGPDVDALGPQSGSDGRTPRRIADQSSAASASLRSSKEPDMAVGHHHQMAIGVGVGVEDGEVSSPRQRTPFSAEGGPLATMRQNTQRAGSSPGCSDGTGCRG